MCWKLFPGGDRGIAGLQGRLGHSHRKQSMRHARHEDGEVSNMERAAQSTELVMPGWMEELPKRDEEARDSQIVPT